MNFLNRHTLTFKPVKLKGEVTAPPSKSDAHRAILGAALCQSVVTVHNIVLSDDILASLDGLKAFGINYHVVQSDIIIMPSMFTAPLSPIDCNESGSTLRFLLPFGLLLDRDITFTGRGRLIHRPIKSYIQLFDACGVKYTYDEKLPITLHGAVKLPEQIEIDASLSSQPLTGLLFALSSIGKKHCIVVKGELASKYYIDMTLNTLKHYGIAITRCQNQFIIQPNQHFTAKDYSVEGDYSNAAFWFVAGTICGEIDILGLNPNSYQGDKKIVDIINKMGGNITYNKGIYHVFPSKTYGTQIDARHIVDLVPILCVLASVSQGVTTITGAAHLKFKESDRIKATVDNLLALGADIKATEDGMVIRGVKRLIGGVVNSFGDHRIAMAMAIASTVSENKVILNRAHVIRKSYPDFYHRFEQLGGCINE